MSRRRRRLELLAMERRFIADLLEHGPGCVEPGPLAPVLTLKKGRTPGSKNPDDYRLRVVNRNDDAKQN